MLPLSSSGFRPASVVRSALVLALAIVPSGPAFATDGVREINQTCAVQSGCFDGDPPGFPVTITTSGSYRLTSNLDYPGASASAITLAASDVALDLGGHTVKGTNNCTVGPNGWVTGCSENGGFTAIDGFASVRDRVTNGRVFAASEVGIHLADASEVRDVQVSNCSNTGVVLGSRSIVASVSSIGNGANGIAATGPALVRDVVVTNNRLDGVTAGPGSTVSGSTTSDNGSDGITATTGSLVRGNTSTSNGAFGLNLSGSVGYVDNAIFGNQGTVQGGVNAGGNVCNGTTTCP